MGKKPTSTPPPPPAPEGLSPKAQALWDAAMAWQKRWNAARLETLYQGLCALDRADEARMAVSRDGLTTITETTKAVHVHPAAKLEREFRQQALRVFDDLGLLSLGGGGFTPTKFLDLEHL